MARHAHEMQCDGRGTFGTPANNGENCGWFNYPMLSDEMNGNYTIKCGNCGHLHYRVIVKGVVTADRHSKDLGEAELIHVMPSACSKERRVQSPVSQLRQREAAGLNK